MDCKEFEKLIPEFIERRMDHSVLKRFIEHMERCEKCKEELVIQLLVTEGVQHLEDGGAFDLQEELEGRMQEARRKLRFHRRFYYLGLALEMMGAMMFIGVIVWILL